MKISLVIILSKVVQIICGFIGVKILTDQLGVESYGVWAVYLTIISLLSLFDVGLNNSNLNREISKSSKTGFIVVHNVSTVVGVIASLIFLPIIYAVMHKHTTILSAIYAILTAGAFYISNYYKSSINSSGNGYLISVVDAIFSAGLVLALFMISKTKVIDLNMLMAIYTMQMICIMMTLRFLLSKKYVVEWKLKMMSRKKIFMTYGLMYKNHNGKSFFLMQLTAVLATQLDIILIYVYLGSKDAAIWAVAYRLISPINTIASTILVSERKSFSRIKGEFGISRLKTAYVKLKYEFALLGLAAITISVYGDKIISVWTNHKIIIPDYLMIMLATWMLIDITGRVTSEYLLSRNEVKSQLNMAMANVATSTVFKVVLLPILGPLAMPLSNSLSYLMIVAPVYTRLVQK